MTAKERALMSALREIATAIEVAPDLATLTRAVNLILDRAIARVEAIK